MTEPTRLQSDSKVTPLTPEKVREGVPLVHIFVELPTEADCDEDYDESFDPLTATPEELAQYVIDNPNDPIAWDIEQDR